MIDFWIEDAGKELYRQKLSNGRFSFGRTEENNIWFADPNLSRKHLQIEISDYNVRITDLGSTNGTSINSSRLTPHRAAEWSEGHPVHIGRLTLQFARIIDQPVHAAAPDHDVSASSPPAKPSRLEVATIICPQAEPPVTTLTAQNIFVGQHPSCTIRLKTPGAAFYHCALQLGDGFVTVTNLDADKPARLEGVPMAVGQPQMWHENEVLQIDGASLHLTFDPQGKFAATQQHRSTGSASEQRSGIWRYAFALAALTVFLLVCMGITVVAASSLTDCGTFNPRCVVASFGSGSTGDGPVAVSGAATPTLASQSGSSSSSGGRIISFATETPIPTATPAECVPVTNASGWLELPFPYEGIDAASPSNAEQFRRISQRSRFGGRINSFFDHEFPVYPPNFGGREPENTVGTLVTFNGDRSIDGFAQDTEGADWYSGHPGIDFSPAHPREETTPILAAAEGRLVTAKIDNDGNHLVLLEHDPDGDGFYEYQTHYYHMFPDQFFEAMLAMEEGAPVAARQRIGTMGTTGRSSGIHLHFEVRKDVNRDGWFTFFERVDPYGFFPTEQFPVDPWSESIEWVDPKGELIEHDGILSEYLWVHSLVDIDDEMGECIQVTSVKVDLNLYPVLGYSVVNPGFTYIARNQQGEVLREGQPQLRRITILKEHMEGVDPDTISLEFLDPELDVWFSVNEDRSLVENQRGGYTFSATIRKTGRYVLVGRETVDKVAPITTILLDGPLTEAGSNAFKDSVTVTLDPVDRGLITSEIVLTQYSLDCGSTWVDYSGPFTVTSETPHTCGDEGSGSQGINFGEGEFLLLAFSEDSANNFEQPPSQVRFSIQ